MTSAVTAAHGSETCPSTSPSTEGTDPLRALWNALGRPSPPTVAPARAGRCARCATGTDQAFRVKAVVSDKFTGWDQYTRDVDPVWCPACTWAHTTPEVRTRPWVITPTSGQQANPGLLASTLADRLPATTAVLIPLSRQKHILPHATWGHVTVDDRTLRWGPREVGRLATLTRLRTLGFSEAALSQPVPRFEQFATLPPGDMAHVLTAWADLEPWRTDTAYLKAALLASRPPRTTGSLT